MSALGQKQTFALQQVMSALRPKADIGAAQINVRFVPIADMTSVRIGVSPTQSKRGRLFDALTVYRYEPIVPGR
jgi:hypothetical protein